MTLADIHAQYARRAQRIETQIVEPGVLYGRVLQMIADAYVDAAKKVQVLIDQGPLPTGQVWNLDGHTRGTAGTAWGGKHAKTAAK